MCPHFSFFSTHLEWQQQEQQIDEETMSQSRYYYYILCAITGQSAPFVVVRELELKMICYHSLCIMAACTEHGP